MSPKTLTALVAASVIAIAAAPASAEDSVQFSYKSYELDTAGGANVLHKRLTKKAQLACEAPGARTLDDMRVEENCTDRLADEFVAKIDHPRLDRIHDAENGSVRIAKRR